MQKSAADTSGEVFCTPKGAAGMAGECFGRPKDSSDRAGWGCGAVSVLVGALGFTARMMCLLVRLGFVHQCLRSYSAQVKAWNFMRR